MSTITRRFAVDADPEKAWQAIADIAAPNRLIDFLGVAYSILSSPFDLEHHHASMQITNDDTGTQFVWITDFAPDNAIDALTPAIDAGVASITRALSAEAV